MAKKNVLDMDDMDGMDENDYQDIPVNPKKDADFPYLPERFLSSRMFQYPVFH